VKRRAGNVAAGFALLVVASAVAAAPITFNTALPVGEGEFIGRHQVIVRERTVPGGEVHVRALGNALGYGVSGRLAVFGVLPVIDRELEAGDATRHAHGFGDLTLFGRYTAWRRDERGRTLRLAPFAGVTAPTGADDESDALGRLPRPIQTGSGVWSGFGGVVITRQTLDWQADAQIAYRASGTDEGYQAGDELRFDASLQYRVWPRSLARADAFGYAVLETGWAREGRDTVGGASTATGGVRVTVSPGVQWVGRRWVIEGIVQIPVVQNLRSTAAEDDYIASAGVRYSF